MINGSKAIELVSRDVGHVSCPEAYPGLSHLRGVSNEPVTGEVRKETRRICKVKEKRKKNKDGNTKVLTDTLIYCKMDLFFVSQSQTIQYKTRDTQPENDTVGRTV